MAAYNAYDRPATLPSNPSAVRVKISTSNQMVYVMEGSKPLLVTPCSVGTSSTPTPKGSFRIFKKDHYHRANSHGFAYNGSQIKKCYLSSKPAGWKFKGTPMPYWCEFKTHYGIHAGWIKDHPCTHGCVRLHVNVAPKFYRLVKVGTPVYIAHSQPEDATIGRNVPRPPDAGPLPDYPGSLMLDSKIFTMHKKPTYQ
ncbi:L,D-transpeptidase [Verrucomicrobiaceae bacterium N1E253]|uniref:L,D-transpeptidase n=2 Tax=Oceaniferula marina TaxID=2748318 RepID=A0A851GHG6_9BACT|nr:L,D-transpeptidase [Oceaniferula marina]